MESDIILKATDKEAQTLFDSQLATVKLMSFMGDKELYPEMDYNSTIVHKWEVKLRHREDIGKLKGIFSYNKLMDILNPNTMTTKEYHNFRKMLVSAREATNKAFSKVDKIMNHVPETTWGQYHDLKGKLYSVYYALDNKINELDKNIIQNG